MDDGFAAFRESMEAVRAAEAARVAYWADGTALASHERLWGLVEKAPSGAPSPERWVMDNHPEAFEAGQAVAVRSAELASFRDKAHARAMSTRAAALAIMGDALGIEAAEAVSAGTTAAEAREAAYAKGQALAQENLGLKQLRFDPGGPFTVALHQRIAAALDLPAKGKGWLAKVDHACEASDRRGWTPFA